MADGVLDLNDDLVCSWEIRLPDGIHTVMFEHGSTSGKRVITVDGVEVLCEWGYDDLLFYHLHLRDRCSVRTGCSNW